MRTRCICPGEGVRPVLLLGSGIVPVWAAPELPFDIALRVQRGDAVAYEGTTSTASITRPFEDLAAWLMAALTFPVGAILLTGTGIVPDESFTLRAGDVVTVDIPGIGTLTNPVILVGRNLERGEAMTVQRLAGATSHRATRHRRSSID